MDPAAAGRSPVSAGTAHPASSPQPANPGAPIPVPVPAQGAAGTLADLVRDAEARGDRDGLYRLLDQTAREPADLAAESARALAAHGMPTPAERLLSAALRQPADRAAATVLLGAAMDLGFDELVGTHAALMAQSCRENAATVPRKVTALAVDLVRHGATGLADRVLAAAAPDLADPQLLDLSDLLLAQGLRDLSVRVFAHVAAGKPVMSILVYMDMLRSHNRPQDAQRLFVEVLEADPARAERALTVMRNVGRAEQGEQLLAAVAEHSAASGARVCLALAEAPPRYAEAVLAGLARQPLDALADALEIFQGRGAPNRLDPVVLSRPPAELAASVGRLSAAGRADQAGLLLGTFARAPFPLVVDAAAALVREELYRPAYSLLNAGTPLAPAAEVARAVVRLDEQSVQTVQILVGVACIRHPHLPALFSALTETGHLDLARDHLRELIATMPAHLLADLFLNLLGQGCDDMGADAAFSASARPDFTALIEMLHQTGRHKLAYQLRNYA